MEHYELLPTTSKGFNMEFKLNHYDLYDLQIDEGFHLIVECEPDADYSPQDGVDNEFCWSLMLVSPDGTRKEITDDLTESDQDIVAEQVADFFDDFFGEFLND
jgi:hypothetical protein